MSDPELPDESQDESEHHSSIEHGRLINSASPDDYEFEDTTEVDKYLKAVRDEEQQIERTRDLGSSRLDGFHHADDAIIGTALENEQHPSHDAAGTAIEAYTSRILDRFFVSCSGFESIDTRTASRALRRWMKTDLGDRPNKSCHTAWNQFLRHKPDANHIHCMTKETKFRLLELVVDGLNRGKTIRVTMSRWIWALLAGLPSKMDLNADDLAALRRLGKRAAWVLLGYGEWADATEKLWDEEANDTGEEKEGESIKGDEKDEASHEGDSEVLEENSTASERVRNPDATTKFTLDFILVIVGQVFGQRDLLEHRKPFW